MDPNAALRTIREERVALEKLLDQSGSLWAIEDAAAELASAVRDLDEWLSNGGFLPDEWGR